MVQNVANQGSAFGGISRIGTTQNGRIIYEITDYNGNEAGKMTVPMQDADTFEKSYQDIMETAPKLQKYALEHSSEQDMKKRKRTSRIIIGLGTLIGAGIPIYLTRKSPSTIKQVLATAGGMIAGLAAGLGISLAVTTPPGMMKFSKAAKNISKIDVQPLEETP